MLPAGGLPAAGCAQRSTRAAGAGAAPRDITVSIHTHTESADKAVDGVSPHLQKRKSAYRLHDRLSRLLPAGSRESACHRFVSRAGACVVASETAGHVHARYAKTYRCGNVWVCPLCAPIVAAARAAEIGAILRCGDGEGFRFLKLALTCRHSSQDKLADLLKRQVKALAAFKNSRVVRRIRAAIGYVDSITAKEATWGPLSGWHPHQHEYWQCNLPKDFCLAVVAKELELEWIKALAKHGLDGAAGVALFVGLMKRDEIKQGTASGYLSKSGTAAGYLAKAGAAIEIAGQAVKGGGRKHKIGHYHPMQLLSLEKKWADALFLEFYEAFRCRKQIVVGKLLKRVYDGLDVPEEQSNGELVAKQDRVKANERVVFSLPHRGLFVLRKYGVAVCVLELVEEGKETEARELVDVTMERERNDAYERAVSFLTCRGLF